MRIHLLSDLHIEHNRFEAEKVDCDVVVLAGDISRGEDAIYSAHKLFPDKPVILVPGNHEFYSHQTRTIEDIHRSMRLASASRLNKAAAQVSLLDPGVVEIEGWRFIGATLWTDFDLFGIDSCDISMRAAEQNLNDYRLIHLEGKDGYPDRFTPSHARKVHLRERAFIFEEIKKGDPDKTVVVTHFPPSPQAIAPRFKGDALSPAFVSVNAGVKIHHWPE